MGLEPLAWLCLCGRPAAGPAARRANSERRWLGVYPRGPRAALSGPTTAHTQPPSLPAPCGSQNILPGADTSIGQLRAAAPDSRRATTTSATTQTKRPQLGALRQPPARRRVSAKRQNIFALLLCSQNMRLCGAAAASVRAAAAPGAPDRRTGRAQNRRRLRIRLAAGWSAGRRRLLCRCGE